MLDQLIGGRYKVVAKLGEGGMGSVYEARHTATSRRVAVKLISADSSRSASHLTRFETEAKSAGQLESQYIAQVLDAGRDEERDVPFLVMEYLAGEDLAHVFARLAPLDADLTLRLMAQACMGLEKAHAAGIVHRDIKPANLLLAERDAGERVLKILDFGIAKLIADGAKGPTRTGALIGSPMYMSPEQARGAGGIDHRSDLWSLGVVMYEALAGKTPFHAIEGFGDLLMTICTEEPPSVREVAPWVDEGVAKIVAGALKIDAAERFQSAADMLKAIRAHLPMGTGVTADMLVPADQSRRPTVGTRPRPDTALEASHVGAQLQATLPSPHTSATSAVAPSSTGAHTAPVVVGAPPGQAAAFQHAPVASSAQPMAAHAYAPTMASATGGPRVGAPPLGPVSQGVPSSGGAPAWPSAPAPMVGWVPQPAAAPAPVPHSRMALYFGCGVAACFMAFVVLVVGLVLLADVDESESSESGATTPGAATTSPGAPIPTTRSAPNPRK